MNNLSSQDYQTIVYDWNRTDKDYPKDRTIYQLFEGQVGTNPNNIALVFEEQQLTYKQLNEKANQLARYIRKRYKKVTNEELQADTLIPLCLERSIDMVIAIVAVMKAGGAYVPMDPEYPVERFRHILVDTEAKLVITQSHIEQRLKEVRDIELISIDDQDNETVYQNEDVSNLPRYSQSTDLAYVIYTSGTTGLPKGAMIEHRQINLKIITVINDFGISEKDVIGSKINYAFDPFAREIFVALATGAKLIVFSRDDVYDFDKLIENVYKYEITYLIFVASQLELFVDYVKSVDISKLSSLRLVFNCGERLPSKLAKDFYAVIDGMQLVNQYGPSECTQYTTHYLVNKFDEVVPVGKPMSNTQTYILDQYMAPVSIGVIGELYIGGAGLARGYLNCSELTEERFVSNPFATEGDIAKGYTRLYKTGDLVIWLPDGNIEYIGRNDDQVKIRGYRIELGEIEHQLSSIEGIKQSCVLAKESESNSKYLVGYYVLDKETTLTQEEILNRLAKVLPEYMVPSILVELEGMPLTVNGKLDRRALPKPDFVNEASYVAPTTELEVTLCNIFAEVLGLEKVGVTDNFFRIGGNSILAIKIVSKVNAAQLNFKLNVKNIFYYQSISNLINRRLTDIEKGQLSSLTFRKGKYAYEYWDHRPRIMDYEHLTQSEQREFYNILSQMSRDVDQMADIIGTAKGCILACNEAGNKPPIFWVCNNWTEFSNLAKIIGADQPLYGMRSLHTYAKDSDKYRKFQEHLCLYYFNQISQLCNIYEPFVVFGNCQSGMFAESIVVHFKRMLNVSPYLATLEYFPKAYDGRCLMMYGVDSSRNPFVNSDRDPIPMWNKIFEGYEYKILPAKHGQFFKEPCIIDTSRYLSNAIDLINKSKNILASIKDDIPKIIIQYWSYGDIPSEVQDIMQSWIDHNPSYQHIVFNKSQAIEFIEKEYGQEVKALFLECILPAMESDFFRLAYILKHGGIYADARLKSSADISALISEGSKVYFLQRNIGVIRNGFIVAKPQHYVIKLIFESMISNMKSKYFESIWDTTGPGNINSVVQSLPYVNLRDVVLLDEAEMKSSYFELQSCNYNKSEKHWSKKQLTIDSIFASGKCPKLSSKNIYLKLATADDDLSQLRESFYIPEFMYATDFHHNQIMDLFISREGIEGYNKFIENFNELYKQISSAELDSIMLIFDESIFKSSISNPTFYWNLNLLMKPFKKGFIIPDNLDLELKPN